MTRRSSSPQCCGNAPTRPPGFATVAEAVSDLEDLLSDVPRKERVLPDFRCCGKANRPVPPILPGGSKSVEVKSKIAWGRGAMSKTGQRPSVSPTAA
jgi:hypothetical protein